MQRIRGVRGATVSPKVEAKSSGSSHSADAFSLLLLDENNLELGMQEKDLAYDPRPRLEPDELEEILLEKCADIVIKVASVGKDRIVWKFICSASCMITHEETVKLYGRYIATSITVRRLSPCNSGQIINFILIKTIKAKANGLSELFLSAFDRKQLAYAVFKLLLGSGPLTFVLGNIGFADSSIFSFSKEYAREMGEEVLSGLKVLTNRDQSLHCMYFKKAEKHFQLLVDINTKLPLRIFSLVMQAVQD